MYNIAVIPGDGTGPEVVTEGLKVLKPPPKNISSNITSSIRITLGGEKAPYATAYEWGSRIHATRGEVGVYPLAARPGTKNLVFWWENRGKLFVGPALPIGHPGVAPKPYIKPVY